MVSTTDTPGRNRRKQKRKKSAKPTVAPVGTTILLLRAGLLCGLLRGFFFRVPRSVFRKRNLTKLDAEETKAFLKLMEEPIVYNEALTAALEAHDKQVTSKWSKKN